MYSSLIQSQYITIYNLNTNKAFFSIIDTNNLDEERRFEFRLQKRNKFRMEYQFSIQVSIQAICYVSVRMK